MAGKRKTRRINLALQGGGAHGAFTWGVLERLLDEDWLEIAGISGTSAGALNAAAVKAGLAQASGREGREAAKTNLAHVWEQVGRLPDLRFQRLAMDMTAFMPPYFRRMAEIFSPVGWMNASSRMLSPYDYGPFWKNPLAAVVRNLPFDDICADAGPKLFISATNVRTGKIRVFSGKDISVDAVLASACLPTLFRAVEIRDPETGYLEAYWDGGYVGNPALFPLFLPELPSDIMVVGINPFRRERLPRTPMEIDDRINEISFNSSLLREMRAIDFVKRLIGDGRLENLSMKDIMMHIVADDVLMNSLSVETKMLPDSALQSEMRAAGQKAADDWLEAHADDIGVRPSVDLAALFS